jgi:hypothetical protein
MKRRIISIIVGVVLIGVLAWLLFTFNATISSALSVVITDALWASVFATIVLIIINAIYTIQTHQTINEMQKARKAEFFPHIRVDLDWLGPVFLLLRCTNFGKGPATNIKAEIVFQPSGDKRHWNEGIMAPSENIRLFLPDGDVEKVAEKSATISIKGEYEDIFGQKFVINESLNTEEFVKQAKQLQQLVEKDLVREVSGINKGLDEIKKALTNIASIAEERKTKEYFGAPENVNPKVLEERTKALKAREEPKEK